MEKETKKFLEAEETAEKLVQNMKKLNSEAMSYKTATKELDKTRQRLIGLADSTQRVANGSLDVIRTLKEIGGPKILSSLEKLENNTTTEFSIQTKDFKKLKKLIVIAITSSIIAVILGLVLLLR